MQHYFRRIWPYFILAFLVSTPSIAQTEHKELSQIDRANIEDLIASEDRSESHKARDKYRHPLETLTFFGFDPEMTVVEIWPGGQGGWYRAILEPFFEGRGTYIPVRESSGFPDDVEFVPYGEVDMVMVFRAHGFMIYRESAQTHVNALYKMLKPGGIFAIVDHAGDEEVPQDPNGDNGYVNESHFRSLAIEAGFVILAESDINRNPKDTKGHPRGVYSLPPSLWGTRSGTEGREKYLEIGESDRFTLKFYKPE